MTMNRRAAELGVSLQRELETVSQQAQLDQLGRLHWLRDQLENYLDRWLAFAAIETIPMKSLLNDDLYAMTLVASEIFSQQLKRSTLDHSVESWSRFDSMLRQVAATKDRSKLAGLRPALDAIRSELH